jgi:uncharacterized protein
MTSPTTSPASQSPLTSSSASMRGRFLWHELLCEDVQKALAFYPAVTGWTTTSMPPAPGAAPYDMFMNGASPVAGVMSVPATAESAKPPTAWLSYIGTADVDATFADATSLGATGLMPPTDVPTVGRIAVLADPQGAQFGLFAPASPYDDEAAPKHGEFSWHELAASDTDAAFGFYERLFGWKKTETMDMGENGKYEMFGRDVFTYGGVYLCPPGKETPRWKSYIQVADLDRATEALRANGGTVVMGPHEVPGGDRIVMCTDDQGAEIALHGKAGG